jgi:AcrR family transcriptional regulator
MAATKATHSRPPSDRRSRRGRPPLISRERIVRAAIDIGIERASMQRIADRLGVTTPALYGHVSGLDEVLDQAAAELLGALTGTGVSLRIDLGGPAGLHNLRVAEEGVRLLMQAGFDPADAGNAIWLVVRVAITAGPTSRASVTMPIAEARRVLDPAALPAMAEAIDALLATTDLDTFAFDLETIIAGLSARVGRP